MGGPISFDWIGSSSRFNDEIIKVKVPQKFKVSSIRPCDRKRTRLDI